VDGDAELFLFFQQKFVEMVIAETGESFAGVVVEGSDLVFVDEFVS